MQYPTLALLGLASSALALPQVGMSGIPTYRDPFGVQASGASISNLYNQVTASRGRIFVGGEQSPVCELGQRQDFATFAWVADSTVVLYKKDNPVQRLWVDTTGLAGFETDGQNTKPFGAESAGFDVNAQSGALTFKGASPKACPVEAGKWSIWFPVGDAVEGASKDCQEITLTAYKTPARVACTYSDPVQV